MTASNANGPEKLRSEILEEARRQREEILGRARDRADQLLAKAQKEAGQIADAQRRAARDEAARRQSTILSTLSIETNRLELDQAETVLNAIKDKVLEQVHQGEGFDRRDTLISLTREALRQMNGNTFLLRLSMADLGAFGDGLEKELRGRGGLPLVKLQVGGDPEATDGDWILQDEDGRQIWDLGLEARLERLWPELRRQIAAQAGLVKTTTDPLR